MLEWDFVKFKSSPGPIPQQPKKIFFFHANSVISFVYSVSYRLSMLFILVQTVHSLAIINSDHLYLRICSLHNCGFFYNQRTLIFFYQVVWYDV